MQITFDGISLMTTPYTVKNISNDSVENREVFVYGLARQRGAHLLNAEYKAKIFRVTGTITGADRATLEANVDEFKELMSRQEKNLDIEYAGGTRRYVATAQSINIDRDFYHNTFTPFEVDFLVPSGIGTDIASSNDTASAISTLDRIAQTTVLGTAQPKMKTTIDITAASGITQLDLLANGDKITLITGLVAGDQIIIDENTLKVTVNGVEQDYTGIFPRFLVGANVYQLLFTGTSITYNLTFSYIKTYL